jgi:hypothetical protein
MAGGKRALLVPLRVVLVAPVLLLLLWCTGIINCGNISVSASASASALENTDITITGTDGNTLEVMMMEEEEEKDDEDEDGIAAKHYDNVPVERASAETTTDHNKEQGGTPTQKTNRAFHMIRNMTMPEVVTFSFGDGDDYENCPTSSLSSFPAAAPSSSSFSRLYKDPLECWLWNLKAFVPDQDFKEGVFDFGVRGMTCTHFVLQTVDSHYKQPATKVKATDRDRSSDGDGDDGGVIQLTLKGIAATCQGQYHGPLYSSGMVTASVGDGSSMSLELEFRPDADNYFMSSVSLKECDSSGMHVPPNGISFEGSMSAKFINLFRTKIATYISQSLGTSICPGLKPAVETQLTQTIQNVNTQLKAIIQGGTPAPYDPPENIDIGQTLSHQSTTATTSHNQGPSSFEFVRHLMFDQTFALNESSSSISSRDDNNNVVALLDLKQDTPLLYDALLGLNTFLTLSPSSGSGNIGTTDNSNCTSSVVECGVNALIRLLTNGTGEVDIVAPTTGDPLPLFTFNHTLAGFGKVGITLNRVHISGLAQLQSATLLKPSRYRPRQTNSTTIKSKSESYTEEDGPSSSTPSSQQKDQEQDYPYRGVTAHLVSSNSNTNNNNNHTGDGQGGQKQSQSLNITTEFKIRVDPIPGGSIQGDPLEEVFSVEVDVSHIDLMLRLVFGLHRDKVMALPFGTLLDPTAMVEQHHYHRNAHENDNNIDNDNSRPSMTSSIISIVPSWQCLLDSVLAANVTDLGLHLDVERVSVNPVSVASVKPYHIHDHTTLMVGDGPSEDDDEEENDTNNKSLDSLELALDQLTNNFLSLFIAEYPQVIRDAVYGILQGTARHALNSFFMDFVHNNTATITATNNHAKSSVSVAGGDSEQEKSMLDGQCTMIRRPTTGNNTDTTSFSSSSYLELDTSPFVQFLSRTFSGPMAVSELNKALGCFVKDLSLGGAASESQSHSAMDMPTATSSGSDAPSWMQHGMVTSSSGLSARVERLEVEHLDSLYDLGE